MPMSSPDGDPGRLRRLREAVVAATGPWAGELVMPAFQGFWAETSPTSTFSML